MHLELYKIDKAKWLFAFTGTFNVAKMVLLIRQYVEHEKRATASFTHLSQPAKQVLHSSTMGQDAVMSGFPLIIDAPAPCGPNLKYMYEW